MFLFISNWGPTELIVLLVIVLVLFGGRKLPSLARSIGAGINEFKRGLSTGDSEKQVKQEEKEQSTKKKSSSKKSSKK